MEIDYSKLDKSLDTRGFVINLKSKPENVVKLINHKNIFPAYHMNKKHWITVLLNGSLEDEEIFELIIESNKLVRGKK